MKWHIWIDECMPLNFRAALSKVLGLRKKSPVNRRTVFHEVSELAKGVDDTEWLMAARKAAGSNPMMLITQDTSMRRKKGEAETIQEFCELAIFLQQKTGHQDAMRAEIVNAVARIIEDRLSSDNKFVRRIHLQMWPPYDIKRELDNEVGKPSRG